MTKQTAHCPLTLITGGIGSGKSVVSRICRLRGYEVYDTDYEAKRIMDHDAKIRHAITSRWGSAAVFPDGSLNRKHIASVIFADDQERLWLNALVHSAVRKELEARISLRSYCGLLRPRLAGRCPSGNAHQPLHGARRRLCCPNRSTHAVATARV